MYAYHIWYDVEQNKFLMSDDNVEVGYSSDFSKYFTDPKVAGKIMNKLNRVIPDSIKVCSQCGRIFWLDKDEQDWYARKNLCNPKKCVTCRHMSKEAEEQKHG